MFHDNSPLFGNHGHVSLERIGKLELNYGTQGWNAVKQSTLPSRSHKKDVKISPRTLPHTKIVVETFPSGSTNQFFNYDIQPPILGSA